MVLAGSLVKAGQKLAVLSAMKMETAVQSPCDGLVRHVGVSKGDSLDAGAHLTLLLFARITVIGDVSMTYIYQSMQGNNWWPAF